MDAHPNAWMTKELFMNWIFHFSASVLNGVSLENRHLLIFYGHGSHIDLQTVQEENMMVIDFFTQPTHTTHRLHPLDASVFGPFKCFFMNERVSWMDNKPRIEAKRDEFA